MPNDTLAGFWKRIFALLLDGLILAVVGMVIGAFAEKPLEDLHSAGRLIGFVIAGIYMVVLDSIIGGGATFGKRAMHLQVVGKNGQPVGVQQALVRYLVLAVPYFVNGLAPTTGNATLDDVLLTLETFAIFGVGIPIIYLYIANKRTRQSLHDLAAGTYVRSTKTAWTPPAEPIARVHRRVAIAWCGVLILGAVWSMLFVSKDAELAELISLRSAVSAQPGVWQVGVTDITNSMWMNGKTLPSHRVLTITATCDSHCADSVQLDTARIVLTTDPTISGAEYLNIYVVRGFELGIWAYHMGYNESETPEVWRQKLATGPNAPRPL